MSENEQTTPPVPGTKPDDMFPVRYPLWKMMINVQPVSRVLRNSYELNRASGSWLRKLDEKIPREYTPSVESSRTSREQLRRRRTQGFFYISRRLISCNSP